MARKIIISPGEYYHVYNRGVDKRQIFYDDIDRRRFIVLLYLCNSKRGFEMRELEGRNLGYGDFFGFERGETLVDIGAYCLMPNHFHILLKEKGLGGSAEFLRRLSVSYTAYFNKKYERSGHLFQGRYKAEHVSNDRYLKYIFSYIHLNPAKLYDPAWKERTLNDERILDFVDRYEFSSLFDYRINGRARYSSRILQKDAFPEYFSDDLLFKSHITDFLKTETQSP